MNPDQLRRFSRQIILPVVGGAGQRKLLESHVLMIGAGGLGCPVGLGLAGAGVGAITLVDPDTVDISNLHRQLAFTEADIGRPKVTALAEALRARASAQITERQLRAEAASLPELLDGVDLVIDGSDNFEARFAVADAAVAAGVPLISGAVTGFAGQLLAQRASGGPCYRCLFERPPEQALSCDAAGILPGATMAVAGMMVQWAILALMGRPELPWGRLLQGDLMAGTWRGLGVPSRPDCPTCGANL